MSTVEAKRMTIRLSPELHHQLRRAAADEAVSLNTLAVQALEAYVQDHVPGQSRFPLRELSALLAPAAEAAELTEEELLRHARRVRHRIWEERYEETGPHTRWKPVGEPRGNRTPNPLIKSQLLCLIELAARSAQPLYLLSWALSSCAMW